MLYGMIGAVGVRPDQGMGQLLISQYSRCNNSSKTEVRDLSNMRDLWNVGNAGHGQKRFNRFQGNISTKLPF